MNLVSFRGFLKILSCLPPEFKERPCKVDCFTSPQKNILCLLRNFPLKSLVLSQKKLLYNM